MAKPLLWTDELVQNLRELWPTHSAGEIINCFRANGYDLSRNAVIGKAHRIGLSFKDKRSVPVSETELARIRAERLAMAQQQRRARKNGELAVPMPFKFTPRRPPTPQPPRVVYAIKPPLDLTFMQITDQTCKYECSDQQTITLYTFCGHPVEGDRPYCEAHARLIYIKPPVRERKPSFTRAA
jgi:hypothetical protein